MKLSQVTVASAGGSSLSSADHPSKQQRAGSTSTHQSGVAHLQRIAAGITVIAPQDGTTAKIAHLCLLPDARCLVVTITAPSASKTPNGGGGMKTTSMPR